MEYCLVKYLRLEFQVSKGGGGTRLVWRIFTRDGLNFRWPCYNLVSHYLVQSICISFSRARTYLQKVSFEGAEVWAHLEKNLGKESATKKNLTTPCIPLLCVRFSIEIGGEERRIEISTRQRHGSAVKKKSLDGSVHYHAGWNARTACESGC